MTQIRSSPVARRSLTALTVLALLFGAGPAAAQDPAAAKRLYQEGVTAYRQARYQEAITAFEAAYTAKPSGVIFFNLAQCHEKLGQLEQALTAYRRYLEEEPLAEDRTTVLTAIANLEARVEQQRIQQVLVRSDPSGAAVRIDGSPRGETPTTAALEAGTHTLELALEGYRPVNRTFETRGGSPLQLDLVLSPLDTQPARTWTWVTLGTAGATLVGGLVAGLMAQADQDALLGARHLRPEVQTLHDGALAKAQTANVLYGVGAGLAVVGGVLFFVEGSF